MELLEKLAEHGIAGVALAIALLTIFLLAKEVRDNMRREVTAVREHAGERIADHLKVYETAAAIKASLDALSINIEHRNELTEATVASQRAIADGIHRLMESSAALERLVEKNNEACARIEAALARRS